MKQTTRRRAVHNYSDVRTRARNQRTLRNETAAIVFLLQTSNGRWTSLHTTYNTEPARADVLEPGKRRWTCGCFKENAYIYTTQINQRPCLTPPPRQTQNDKNVASTFKLLTNAGSKPTNANAGEPNRDGVSCWLWRFHDQNVCSANKLLRLFVPALCPATTTVVIFFGYYLRTDFRVSAETPGRRRPAVVVVVHGSARGRSSSAPDGGCCWRVPLCGCARTTPSRASCPHRRQRRNTARFDDIVASTTHGLRQHVIVVAAAEYCRCFGREIKTRLNAKKNHTHTIWYRFASRWWTRAACGDGREPIRRDCGDCSKY